MRSHIRKLIAYRRCTTLHPTAGCAWRCVLSRALLGLELRASSWRRSGARCTQRAYWAIGSTSSADTRRGRARAPRTTCPPCVASHMRSCSTSTSYSELNGKLSLIIMMMNLMTLMAEDKTAFMWLMPARCDSRALFSYFFLCYRSLSLSYFFYFIQHLELSVQHSPLIIFKHRYVLLFVFHYFYAYNCIIRISSIY